MKGLIWLFLFLVGLLGVFVPIFYFINAAQLPPLESEFDLERDLRERIEGERMEVSLASFKARRTVVPFVRPSFAQLPKDLVALYLSINACPTYFRTPREGGFEWGWRLFAFAAFGAVSGGDGACELTFSRHVADVARVPPGTKQAIASHRIHSVLQHKDQLVAYDLATVHFDRGVFGVEDGAQVLFGRELARMGLSEMAELSLAFPVIGFFNEVKTCRNAALIQQSRDFLLDRLAQDSLIPKERALGAKAAPVACLRRGP